MTKMLTIPCETFDKVTIIILATQRGFVNLMRNVYFKSSKALSDIVLTVQRA